MRTPRIVLFHVEYIVQYRGCGSDVLWGGGETMLPGEARDLWLDSFIERGVWATRWNYISQTAVRWTKVLLACVTFLLKRLRPAGSVVPSNVRRIWAANVDRTGHVSAPFSSNGYDRWVRPGCSHHHPFFLPSTEKEKKSNWGGRRGDTSQYLCSLYLGKKDTVLHSLPPQLYVQYIHKHEGASPQALARFPIAHPESPANAELLSLLKRFVLRGEHFGCSMKVEGPDPE